MGFRFRKSFGKGPFRFNVSKSGIGWSIGTKGARYTKKATGGTRTTLSVPGTGISYVTESSKSKPKKESKKMRKQKKEVNMSPENQKPKKPFWKRWWVWVLIITCLFGSCGQGEEVETEEITPPAIVVEENTSKVEESEPVEIPEIEEPMQTEPPVTETIPPTEETEELEATPPPAKETEPLKILVYTTPAGKNYHKSTCRFVKNKDVTEWEIEDAIVAGYDQCGTCKPR